MNPYKKYDFYIGIDPGTHTGVAFWDAHRQEILLLETKLIHQVMDKVRNWLINYRGRIYFIVEDARKASHKQDAAKAVGGGMAMRDAAIWDDFLSDIGADFIMVQPKKSLTKKKQAEFALFTGWVGRTSSHARDAGMLVIGRK
jgi:hypothetical protein